MKDQEGFTNFYQQFYLVSIVKDPLRMRELLQAAIFLVGQKGESPVIRSFLHHVICIDRLHVRICSQLESIGVVQFFQERRISPLIFLYLYSTPFK